MKGPHTMSELSNIVTALSDADPTNWTVEGTPRLDVVQKILQDGSITRGDIDATGRTRTMASTPPVKLTPEEAATAADHAEAAVVTAREVVAARKIMVRNLRQTLAESLMRWMGFSPKRDTASLVRENSLRE